jgi:hypothetical protein
MVTTEDGRSLMCVKNIPEFETVVPFQKPDIVITRVHNLEDRRIFEKRSQEGKIKLAKRVEEVSPSTRIYLDQTQDFAKISEGIILCINTDNGCASDVSFRLIHFCLCIDPDPLVIDFHADFPCFLHPQNNHLLKGG